MKCTINVKDEVWCTINGLTASHVDFLWKKLAIYVDGYWFMPAYKLGRFDGKIKFFEKTGKTYVRLLEKILPYIETWGYEIELNDTRLAYDQPEVIGNLTTIDAHGIALEAEGLDIMGDVILPDGKKFMLRPYQLQCVQKAIEAGSGFIIAGTGAGKTSITAGISYLYGEKGHRVITIVPSGDLVDQTASWYSLLDMDVGVYSGESKDIDHSHVVATWQALQYNPEILRDFQALIWDECFSGDTKVLMADLTWKRIDEIDIGNMVMSYQNDLFEPKEVEAVHANLIKSNVSTMLRLTFDNGATLDVTDNHVFYLKDGRKVAAKDLSYDDEIAEFSMNKMKTHGDKANEEERY